jgi:hypothetical protein
VYNFTKGWNFSVKERVFVVTKNIVIACCFFSLFIGATNSMAAYVTTQEAGMDAIFSQIGFGDDSIDIRYNEVTTLVAPEYLIIDSDEEFLELVSPSATTVNMYYVDEIYGSTIGEGYVGLGGAVVESEFAAGPNGAELLAHELGHNLGLVHEDAESTDALMWPILLGGHDLSTLEISDLLDSGLIENDGITNYITINPILLLAAVPIPGAAWLFGSALLGLAVIARKR